MMLYGIGDGGAGPGFEHIERLHRYRDLKSVPRVKPEKALDFFKKADDKITPYPHTEESFISKSTEELIQLSPKTKNSTANVNSL